MEGKAKDLDDNSYLEFRSTFLLGASLIIYVPAYFLMVIGCTGIFGIIFALPTRVLGYSSDSSYIFSFFASVILCFLAFIFMLYTQKKTYEQTLFRFSPTRLDYSEGFLRVEKKTIELRNILEVTLKKGIVQRMFGLGTIVLSTAATGYDPRKPYSGVQLNDLENSDQAYEKIRGWIQRSKPQGAV